MSTGSLDSEVLDIFNGPASKPAGDEQPADPPEQAADATPDEPGAPADPSPDPPDEPGQSPEEPAEEPADTTPGGAAPDDVTGEPATEESPPPPAEPESESSTFDPDLFLRYVDGATGSRYSEATDPQQGLLEMAQRAAQWDRYVAQQAAESAAETETVRPPDDAPPVYDPAWDVRAATGTLTDKDRTDFTAYQEAKRQQDGRVYEALPEHERRLAALEQSQAQAQQQTQANSLQAAINNWGARHPEMFGDDQQLTGLGQDVVQEARVLMSDNRPDGRPALHPLDAYDHAMLNAQQRARPTIPSRPTTPDPPAKTQRRPDASATTTPPDNFVADYEKLVDEHGFANENEFLEKNIFNKPSE